MAKLISLGMAQGLSGVVRHWAYNAIDSMGTRDIADVLLPRMDEDQRRTYDFEMAAQGPAMTMGQRGILIDVPARDQALKDLKAELKALVQSINKQPLVLEHWDGQEKVTGTCTKSTRKDGHHTWAKGEEDTPARLCVSCGKSRFKRSAFNPNSPDQCYHLFYDILGAKKQYNKKHEVSTDEEALDRIGRRHRKLTALTDLIIQSRGLHKQIGFLNTKLHNGRFTSVFNVGAAWTGRWSASKDPYGMGSNAQNISERHRSIFIADPGKEIVYADLKQAESNLVAHLAGDEGYIEAHRSGDVHTYVTRLVWPDLPWTGDLSEDKLIAKTNPGWDPAPGHDHRFQAKRIQHGSNYGLTPFGIAIIAHIPVDEAARAQRNYFIAFPGIPAWQRTIRAQVEASQTLVSPLKVKVRLFGRPWDEHTYKQGLSLLPQGGVAHIINLAAWQIWNEMDPEFLELLAQIHDALLWQQEIGHRDRLVRAAQLMTIPVPIIDIHGKLRYATIEVEIAVGLNWGHFNDNPERGPLNLTGIKEIHV